MNQQNLVPGDEIDLHPRRYRAKLLRWLIISIILHIAAGVILAVSPTIRGWLFQSMQARDGSENMTDSQVQAAKMAMDILTRKRIIECQKRMLGVGTRLIDKRRRNWDEVADRGRDNPHFLAMHQKGLPDLALVKQSGFENQEVPQLYDLALVIENQVITLYEQYKSIGLSLKTVERGAVTQPQTLERSLELCKTERQPRPNLNLNRFKAVIRGLQDGTWAAYREEMTTASDTAELMANNCDRVMQVVESIEMIIDMGSMGLHMGYSKRASWVDDVPYKGDQLRPADVLISKLKSIDMNAKITLGKNLGLDAESRTVDWLAIDTWWQIGPFAYPGGARNTNSLNFAYPPEYGVDLDAVLEGKDGRKLSWFYSPMSSVRMEPRDVTRESIWYFYTQFHSASEQEIYANIASDDYGVMWLNGEREPVYRSAMEPRPWVVLDKTQFAVLKIRKGMNSMLFKLDNYRGTTGFTIIFTLLDKGQ